MHETFGRRTCEKILKALDARTFVQAPTTNAVKHDGTIITVYNLKTNGILEQ